MEFVDQQMPRTIPSSAEWSRLRPVVTELYQGRRWTMTQVSDHLNSLGHRVNARMVRVRITQWNFQRNHQVRDMAAALRLLPSDPVMWPTSEPRFLIRGRMVTIAEVLQFFRRKRIPNPFHWAHSLVVHHEEPEVVLLDAEAANETNNVDSYANASSSSQVASDPSSSLCKQVSTLEQRAVANLHEYCSAYIGLGHAAADEEPPVHQFTVHGRFGNLMQEGLAQLLRIGPGAVPNFQRGFDLIQALLSNCHPMALAQFLAVVCELEVNGAHAILSSLLRYSAMMASSLRVSNFVVEYLSTLRDRHEAESSENMLNLTSLHCRQMHKAKGLAFYTCSIESSSLALSSKCTSLHQYSEV